MLKGQSTGPTCDGEDMWRSRFWFKTFPKNQRTLPRCLTQWRLWCQELKYLIDTAHGLGIQAPVSPKITGKITGKITRKSSNIWLLWVKSLAPMDPQIAGKLMFISLKLIAVIAFDPPKKIRRIEGETWNRKIPTHLMAKSLWVSYTFSLFFIRRIIGNSHI